MKFNISSSELTQTLMVAAGALGTSSLVHILEDFLVEIEEDKMIVSATNMEIGITTRASIHSEESGKAAIPGRLLLETLRALPVQPVEISIDDESQMLELVSSFGKYKIAVDRAADYPIIPKPDTETSFMIPSFVLQSAIANTIFALSTDEIRMAMTGLFTKVEGDKVTFVATDAHKLVRYTFGGIDNAAEASFILPKKALLLLKGVLPENTDVKVSYNRNFAFFEWDETRLSCRLIEAQYPDYNVVIPAANPFKLVINRESLLQSLKRISIFSNKTTNQVILQISESSLTLNARDVDFSNEATEQLSCTFEGEHLSIAFNARFLIEMLSVLKDTDIIMELAAPNKAGLLFPAEQAEREDLLMLVMPVMVPH
jgi:DNA polymerase III subunit beta